MMKKWQSYLIPALVIVLIAGLLSGYFIGKASAKENVKKSEVLISETAPEKEAESKESVTEGSDEKDAAAAEAAVQEKSGTETAASKEDEAKAQETESKEENTEKTDGEVLELVLEEEEGDSEFDVGYHEAVRSAEVDPETIGNKHKTQFIEDLPDDIANTLYGDDAVMQIVVLGDSQFGNFKDEDGMAARLSRYCHANVYNLAIGGTAAAITNAQGHSKGEGWDSLAGCGIVQMIEGSLPSTLLENYSYTKEVFDICDFSKTDYFIVEYGVNDYLNNTPISNNDGASSYRTYAGAMEYIIMTLSENFPDATIVVCPPTYAQFFEGGTGAYLGDGNTLKNSYGTLRDYAETATGIAETSGSNSFSVDGYYALDINSVTARDYLIDGIHLKNRGRKEYAQLLARLMIRGKGYSIDAGVNPDDVDWVSTKK